MKNNTRSVEIWLWSICLLVLAMVGVGGITRLTGSGLSMVEWKPIMGAIPPLSQEHWMEVFEKYQASPQFKLVNSSMTLSGFKLIFFWEWFHRLLGRAIGLFYLVPWIYFLAKKMIPTGLNRTLIVGFLLGCGQGLMGWLMVASGLVEQPHVSHYRLAAHLSFALAIMGVIYWAILGLRAARLEPASKPNPALAPLRKILCAATFLVIIQIIWGALTAGLRAGLGYNTFPMMGSEWFPDAATTLSPLWLNFFENPVAVQFAHRSFGWLLFFSAAGIFLYARSLSLPKKQKRAVSAFTHGVFGQFVLGVLTLVFVVPVHLAVVHQVAGSGVFLLLLWARHSIKEVL